MGRFVGDYFIDILFGFSRGGRGVEQEPRFVVGDPAPVLHRSAKSARDRDVIELGQRIRHAKVIVVVSENLLRAIKRVAALLRFVLCRNHAVIHVLEPGGKRIQLARAQDVEITRHRRRGRETNFFAARGRRLFLHGHV